MGKKFAFFVTETYVFFNDMSIHTFVRGIFDNYKDSAELMNKLYEEKEDMGIIKSVKKSVWDWTIKTNHTWIKTDIQGTYIDIQ